MIKQTSKYNNKPVGSVCWSTDPCTKRLQVQLLVRVQVWIVGSILDPSKDVCFHHSYSTYSGNFSQYTSNKARKYDTGYSDQNGRNKTFYTQKTCLSENPKELTKEAIKLKTEFSQIIKQQINRHKTIIFLYTEINIRS